MRPCSAHKLITQVISMTDGLDAFTACTLVVQYIRSDHWASKCGDPFVDFRYASLLLRV